MSCGHGWYKSIFSVAGLVAGLIAVPGDAFARDKCRNDGRNRVQQSARYRNSDGYNDARGYRARPDDRYQGSYSRNDPYYDDRYYGYSEPRSAGKSAAIIGGSAAAGAAVGAVTGGKKGAIIGGAAGAAGGLIYDRVTRNDPDRRW